MGNPRSKNKWTKLSKERRQIAAINDEPCCRCGKPINYALHHNNKWAATTDHINPIATGGDPHPPLHELAPAHRSCNSTHGARLRNQLHPQKPTNTTPKTPPKPPTTTTQNPNFFPNQPRDPAPHRGNKNELGLFVPELGDEAGSGPEYHADGFPLPRVLPVLPVGAAFDLADDAIKWMDGNVPGEPLLPFERFLLRYTLCTVPKVSAPQGLSLAFPTAVWRMARQQGKTFTARRLMVWRLLEAERWLGVPQRLINTHPDAVQAVALMEVVARSLGYGGRGARVLTADSRMAVWFPGGEEGDTCAGWFARAMTTRALTGHQGVSFAFCDELQDAKDRQVTEALGGTLSGSRVVQPQRVFAGTGQKPESVLLPRMKRMIGKPRVGWLEWSCPVGTDPLDRRAWRWASPDWSEGREAWLEQELELLGVREFASNYLLTDELTSVVGWLDQDLLEESAGEGVGVAARPRKVIGVAWDSKALVWCVVAAAGLPDGRVGVTSVLLTGVKETAVAAAAALTVGGGATLVTPRVSRGYVNVQGCKSTVLVNEQDAAAALEMVRFQARSLLVHDRGDAVVAALAAVPRAREWGRWSAGVMVVLCAWWAGREVPRSRVV